MSCNCPLPTALTTISEDVCPFNMNQISRFFITRASNATFPLTVGNLATDDPSLAAFWSAFTANTVTDDTKVVLTPVVGGDPVIAGGEVLRSGGNDNSTFNGQEETNGTGASAFTCVYKQLTPAQARTMKELECETLKVFMVNNEGKIFGISKDAGVTFDGIAISAQGLGDRNNNGFNSKDTHAFSFSLPPRWDDYLYEVTPEAAFNPLTVTA